MNNASSRLETLAHTVEVLGDSRATFDIHLEALDAYIQQHQCYQITPELLFQFMNGDWLRWCYRLVLEREPDDIGRAHYQSLLLGGIPPLIIFYILRHSQEGRRKARSYQGFISGSWLVFFAKILIKFKLPVSLLLPITVYQNKLIKKADNWLKSTRYIGGNLASFLQNLNHTHLALSFLMSDMSRLQNDMKQLQRAHDILQAKYHYQEVAQKFTSPVTSSQSCVADDSMQPDLQAYYLAFEDAHRGTREHIYSGFEAYATVIQTIVRHQKPALDLGCGRGEWLRWLSQQGLPAQGVDSNIVMVAECQKEGLHVSQADLMSYLREQPANQFSLVTAFHVIEHLPFPVLYELLIEIYRVLAPGGLVILETPNPENIVVGAHTFYHDFTHRSPITPVSIEFLASYHGFTKTEILRRNPHPVEQHLLGDDRLVKQLNHYLHGPQDYALLAYKPD